MTMRYWLYNTAITFAAPAAAVYLAASPRYRRLLGRFSPRVPPMSERPIWVHACSVGEVAVAHPLLEALQDRYPSIPLLLTVSTVTGMDRANQLPLKDVAWFPFDHPLAVNGFLQRANPKLLLLVETELWPNVLRLTQRRQVPAIVVNGRLSDRHYRRYQRGGRVVREMVARLDAAGVQDARYAERYAALGLDPEHIEVTGNIKFDGVAGDVPNEALEALRQECAIPNDVPVIVFGSTRPGDEVRAIDCWRALRARGLEPFLIVAPRHIERVPEVVRLFDEPVQLRSEPASNDARGDSRVLIVDTHGELLHFYGLATVAVIGGSFDSAIQGHNPIEPAALGVPSVFGPEMRNFAGAAEALTLAGGALAVADDAELATAVETLLRDSVAAAQMGQAARDVVQSNRGALERTLGLVDRVAPHLGD